MREILFRGKRKDNGEWEYGDLWCNPYGKRVVCIVSPINDQGTTGGNEVIPETVGQYTGLKDKNGKRIFEGDILHIAKIADGLGNYYHLPLDCPVNVVVKWDLCEWVWETLCENKHHISFPDAWYYYECEVVGNIYDNPEMIGGTNNGCP